MNVISQYLGYGFRILAFVLFVYLALIALDVAHHLYGGWGYVVGILTLPLAVPAAIIYQGFTIGAWLNVLELLLLLPVLWISGGVLIRAGRRA